MDINVQLLSFVSGLGVFNGFILGLYFLIGIRPQRIQNRLFGWILILLSIRIGKSVLLHFNPDLPKPILPVSYTHLTLPTIYSV